MMNGLEIIRGGEPDFDEITDVWERSVRATHHFLAESDIVFLKKIVRSEALAAVELYMIRNRQGHISAFMGVKEDKLEMLFVHPEEMSKGFGKKLVVYAINVLGIRFVDVNEQNPAAAGFYAGLGFEQTGRDDTDDMGNPFPILHLQFKKYRKAVMQDIPELKTLFMTTVNTVNRKDYTPEEVEDWAACGESLEHWYELFGRLQFFVVERQGRIAGFSSVSDTGYLHSMFVHKDHQREGIARILLKIAEEYAAEKGVSVITSDVSITARPFFESCGYKVVQEKTSQAMHLQLVNYKMEKRL